MTMTNPNREPTELDLESEDGARALDLFLRRATAAVDPRAPATFADDVMDSVKRDPGRPSLRWTLFAAAAAAALALGAFFLGESVGEARRGHVAPEDPKLAAPGPARAGSQSLEEAMRAAARGEAGPLANAEGAVKGEPVKFTRGSSTIPSALAGRYPRSFDGRFYALFERRASDLPRIATVAYLLHEAPATLNLPAVAGSAPRRILVSAADGETLLRAWDGALGSDLRPCLLGFAGLVPVANGLDAPTTRATMLPDAPPAASAEFRYGDPARRPGMDEDVVEIVIYVK